MNTKIDLGLDLNPSTITLQTFHTLLAQYPETVRRITRRKALTKHTNKATTKRKKEKRRAPASASRIAQRTDNGNDEGEDEDPDTKRQVDEQVKEFLNLDDWRYAVLPGVVRDREEKEKDGKGYLVKEEVVKLMGWKLSHGVNRPTLLGLIKSNQPNSIQKSTAQAFSTLFLAFTSTSSRNCGSVKEEEEEKEPKFEYSQIQRSLETLTTPLRGVGPATASLILSIAEPDEVPFYSDDVYLWLCLGVYPTFSFSSSSSSSSSSSTTTGSGSGDAEGTEGGQEGKDEGEENEETSSKKQKKDNKKKEVRPNGELNVKYNLAEHRRLWDAVEALRVRLNKEAAESGAGGVSCVDVEKMALVVRHIRESGILKEKNEGKGVVEVEEDGNKNGDEKKNKDEGEDGSEDEERRKRKKRKHSK